MSEVDSGQLAASVIRRRFDRAAAGFDEADFIHRHTFDGLLQRLTPMTLQPAVILDLGCAAGAGTRSLSKQYRRAKVIGVDLSARMLQVASASKGWFSRIRHVNADACALPFAAGSIDLVIANLLLPWLHDPTPTLAEANRVLRKDGLFMFATLGPASLAEIRTAWKTVDDAPHVSPFADMHNIGDALVRAGLRDPVLDVDELTVTYPDSSALFSDLTAAGARNALAARHGALTGKNRLLRFRQALEDQRSGGRLKLRLELVYGHAWGGGPRQAVGEFRLPAAEIGRRRR